MSDESPFTARLTRELAEQLLASPLWMAYMQAVLEAYEQVSERLDTEEHDHRFLQGVKRGLAIAIATPFNVTQRPSPLARPQHRRMAAVVPSAAAPVDLGNPLGLTTVSQPPRRSSLA